MTDTPTAIVCGKGKPKKEPLVFVFYGVLLRRILQRESDGKAIETWYTSEQDKVEIKFSESKKRYDTWWKGVNLGDTGPVAVFRRDERISDNVYTFHALVPAKQGYSWISWLHTENGRQEPKVRSLPALPKGFVLSAANETPDAQVLLWGKDSGGKSAYCVWYPTSGLVSKTPLAGPVTGQVTAAFLGYDKVGEQQVLRLYVGTQETAFTVALKKGVYTFTRQSDRDGFLSGANP
ncbi:hypothetical protein [Streptomyces sp. NPDC017529]|uniref:hypothetical protein n=1 Tax=Streptomyces sp. NPDC017529 TaxID=3365000 RepID=UPI0037B2BC7B